MTANYVFEFGRAMNPRAFQHERWGFAKAPLQFDRLGVLSAQRDFIVIDRVYLTVNEHEIRFIKPVLTGVGWKVVCEVAR